MRCTRTIPEDRLQQARAAAQALGAEVHRQAAVRRRHAGPMSRRSLRAAAQQHLAPDAVGDRRRRHSVVRERRQRAAPVYGAQAVVPPAARRRSRARRAGGQGNARTRSAVRRARSTFDVESSMGGWNAPSTAPWLEAAIQSASKRLLRPRRDVHGRRRHDPVHGHAEREVSRARSSSSPACWARNRTRTARTNSWTSRRASA